VADFLLTMLAATMSEKKRTVVVFGVTGQQGSWTAKAFHDAGWHVIGVSRSPKLAKHCDEMRSADIESAEQVAKACAGAEVVFGVTSAWAKDGKVFEEVEARQAEVGKPVVNCVLHLLTCSQGLIRGAGKAKVPHLVYTSIVSSKRWEAGEEVAHWPHLRSKWIVTRLAPELGVPTTVLGPVMFADNWDSPFMGIVDGQVNGLAEGDAKVPMVACRDIGRLALVAAQQGPPADGKRYLPAFTDFISGDEICKIVGKWHKKPFTYWCPPDLILKLFSPESLLMKTSFTKHGRAPYVTAPETVEQMHESRKLLGGDYWTVETWLKENGFDKRLKPAPTPIWIKAAAVVGVIGAAVAGYFFLLR
jgi:uncharacterized protein YbjT (DUF2867 family)